MPAPIPAPSAAPTVARWRRSVASSPLAAPAKTPAPVVTRLNTEIAAILRQPEIKDLLGKAYRDLAIAFNYAGQLERAEQFANLALKYPGVNPTQVNGPARKIIGDVRTRQGRYDEAIASYEEARQGSSDRFRPLVESSLANALILSGDHVYRMDYAALIRYHREREAELTVACMGAGGRPVRLPPHVRTALAQVVVSGSPRSRHIRI